MGAPSLRSEGAWQREVWALVLRGRRPAAATSTAAAAQRRSIMGRSLLSAPLHGEAEAANRDARTRKSCKRALLHMVPADCQLIRKRHVPCWPACRRQAGCALISGVE